MGHAHSKENTFSRAAVHMGFVPKEDMTVFIEMFVSAQRDHGNRNVHANARMKYLMHSLGIDHFRTLVESYFGNHRAEVRTCGKSYDWKS
jgi:sulfite reductase (ferredoxin)